MNYKYVFIVALFVSEFVCTYARAETSSGIVRGGVADLGKINPDKGVNLSGEWFYFPEEFVRPSQIHKKMEEAGPPRSVPIAKSFPELVGSAEGSSNHSYGTYAVQLKNIPPNVRLGLSSFSVFTAGRLYFVTKDDRLKFKKILTIGKVSRRAEGAVAAMPQRQPVALPKGFDSAILILHVSNFDHTWGGFWAVPEIASYDRLNKRYELEQYGNYFSLGILAFISFFNLCLYLQRPEDKGSFWLAVLSLSLAARSFTYIGGLRDVIPVSWVFSIETKIIYATMLLGPVIGIVFLRNYFPKQFSPLAVKIINWVSYPILAILLLSPNAVWGPMGYPLIYLSVLIFFYLVYGVARALVARETGSLMCSLGAIAIFVGATIETLGAFGVIEPIVNTIIYGINIFLLFQSQIVVSHFVRAFRQSKHLSQQLQAEVDRQTRDIRSILDNIKQGIFTLVDDDKAGSQFSPYTKKILGVDQIPDQTIDQLLLDRSHLSLDQKDQIRAALGSCVGESVLNFEANAGCFPQEIQFEINEEQRTLEVDWNPILDELEDVEKMLICTRDVTELRALRLQAEKNQRDLLILQEIVKIPEDKFSRFLSKSKEFLEECLHLINDTDSQEQKRLKRIFVNYHTLKGTARTFQFKELSTVTHQAEHLLSEILKDHAEWNTEQLLEDLNRVRDCLELYRHIAVDKLHWNLDRKMVMLNRKEMIKFIPVLKDLQSEVTTESGRSKVALLSAKLMENCYNRFDDLIKEAAKGIDSIAHDLDKDPPELTVVPNRILLNDDWTDRLNHVLTHLLRNSIDHGIETPTDRKNAGKRETGNIFIGVETFDDQLQISISDDGRGLNLFRLKNTGVDRGLIDANSSDKQEIADLIFHPGFSTKNQVSEVSGRGIGMGAVKTYVEEGGGQIELVLDEESPDQSQYAFEIVLKLPATAWVEAPAITQSVA